MTLKVEDIFEILEELDTKKGIKNLLKEDGETSLVGGSSKLVTGKAQTITLPKLTVSEDWGKNGTPDRKVLQFIVDRATKGSTGRGSLRKLANLNNYLDVVASKMSTNFSISKLMASMIIVETMMKMFNSFSVGSSGFLNEAFMSVFYGATGEQVQVTNAHGIEDIVVKKPKEYISLKTLEKTRTRLVGSLKLLQKTLDDDVYGNRIFYHLFIKNSKEGKIQNLNMYEIVVDRKFIPVFYEDSIDSKKAFMGLVYVTKRPPPPTPVKTVAPAQNAQVTAPIDQQVVKEEEEDDKANPTDDPTDDKVDDTGPSKTDTTVTPTAQPTVTPPKKSRSKKKPVQPAGPPVKMGPDPNEIDYKQCVLKSVLLRQQGSTKESSEFDVPESTWIRFISYGIPKEGLFLDLSEEKYKKVLERAANLLDAQLSAIFYNLDAFSKSITQFFTDDDTNAGLKAYRHAQELENRTSKLVKKDNETGDTGE